MIDRELAPTTFSIAKFCSSTVALLLKLPLETVLRRGQAAVLSSPAYVRALEAEAEAGPRTTPEGKPPLETVVPVGGYRGVLGTMYLIVNEEGSHVIAGASSASASRAGNNTKGAAASAARKGKAPSVAETVYRRGQGLDGLWRGWKVSWWGLVGLWAAGVLGGGGDGEF